MEQFTTETDEGIKIMEMKRRHTEMESSKVRQHPIQGQQTKNYTLVQSTVYSY